MMNKHEDTLWRLYIDNKDNNARSELITIYTELAKTISAKLFRARFDDDVEFDDYFQFAYIGLLEAVDRYDPCREATFSTFASYRIKGSIISGVQRLTERREQSAFQARIKRERVHSLNNDTNNLSKEDLFNEMVEISVGLAIGFMLDDIDIMGHSVESSNDNTFKSGLYNQLKIQLNDLVNELPERERMIIRYHYFCHLSFQEIAKLMEVSKGRIAQIHKKALSSLHKALGKQSDLDDYY